MSAGPIDALSSDVAGSRSALLSLTLRVTLLSVVTLGLYSFWARTRVRRWLWSALRLGGAPFEYAGRPIEKLMGFVIAAAIVATYLGVVVMLLVFASIELTHGPGAGIAAAVLLVLPVYWFAQYRGLRYLLTHTLWRGLAFGMEPGAWGYAWRATLWTALTVLTAGAALPWRTQALWRYRAERTRYGDLSFDLDPSVRRRLIRLWLPLWTAAWVLVAGAALWGWSDTGGWTDPEATAGFAGMAVLLLGPILAFLWIRWRVASFTILAAGLRLGEGGRLTVSPRTGRVVRIHLLGWIAVGLMLVAVLLAIAIGAGILTVGWVESIPATGDLARASPYLLAALAVLAYLTLFLLRGALRMAFVTYPLIRHVGETLRISGASEVLAVRRGAHRHMADADGFANLFDMGAGV